MFVLLTKCIVSIFIVVTIAVELSSGLKCYKNFGDDDTATDIPYNCTHGEEHCGVVRCKYPDTPDVPPKMVKGCVPKREVDEFCKIDNYLAKNCRLNAGGSADQTACNPPCNTGDLCNKLGPGETAPPTTPTTSTETTKTTTTETQTTKTTTTTKTQPTTTTLSPTTSTPTPVSGGNAPATSFMGFLLGSAALIALFAVFN